MAATDGFNIEKISPLPDESKMDAQTLLRMLQDSRQARDWWKEQFNQQNAIAVAKGVRLRKIEEACAVLEWHVKAGGVTFNVHDPILNIINAIRGTR
jgi:hypothetical protein